MSRVDVVCGSHSHVVPPAEVIEGEHRGTLVLYSVGNATTAMFTDACRASVLVELRCWRDLSGRGRWAWAGADPLFNLFPGDFGPRQASSVSTRFSATTYPATFSVG